MERWLHGALTLSLAPLLLVQGRWVRRHGLSGETRPDLITSTLLVILWHQ